MYYVSKDLETFVSRALGKRSVALSI